MSLPTSVRKVETATPLLTNKSDRKLDRLAAALGHYWNIYVWQ